MYTVKKLRQIAGSMLWDDLSVADRAKAPVRMNLFGWRYRREAQRCIEIGKKLANAKQEA